jgi:hypothetical protein
METRPGTNRGASYDPSVQAPGEKASLIEDFIDIFYAPSNVYARRARSSFWLHLLIITVLAGLFAFASRSVFDQIFDAEFQRGAARTMAANPQITAEQMAASREISRKIGGFFVYMATPLTVFFGALFLWPAARLSGAKISYGQSALIMTLAVIPRLVQGVLNTLQVVLTDTSTITSFQQMTVSPARFMDPDATNRMLSLFLIRFDLFTLWATVLIAIGVAVIGKVSKSRAAIAATVVWLVATLFTVFGQGGGG